METTKRQVLVILFSMFVIKVLSCNLPKSERFSCGHNIKAKEDCLVLNCCYDDEPSVGNTPKCYFRRKDAAGGPIKHSNGLCIYPKDGSTADNTSLVWSTQCSSKNALFLVSQEHSTYHIASGKCILPHNGKGPDPGIDSMLVLGTKNCESNTIRFEAAGNGNLAYYYSSFPTEICIGEGERSVVPLENDLVKISKQACRSDESQHHLRYVYQKTAKQGTVERLTCPWSSAIEITWAYYGHEGIQTKPIDEKTKCKTNAINVLQNRCNGKSYCYFGVHDSFFGITCHGGPTHSSVRYTCNWNTYSVQPQNQPGKNVSLTSFEIRLNRLRSIEKYVQIIVMQLPNKTLPETVPGYYKPRHFKPRNRVQSKPYITAELSKAYVDTHPWFTIGDGKRYGKLFDVERQEVGFINVKLEPETYYTMFKRTFLKKNLYHDSAWMKVVQTKAEKVFSGSSDVPGEKRNVGCQEKTFLKSWKDIMFIGIIGFQFIINIILGFLVCCKICKRHSNNSEKNEREDQEISRKEDPETSKKEESKPQRVSHQYEYPSVGCRKSCDHNVVNGYEELRVQTETEYEHVYHSLKTL